MTAANPGTLLISMPAFNEEESIGKTIAAVCETLGRPGMLAGIRDYRILVVDDGSRDGTAAIAAASGAMVIRHPHNRGVGAAFHSAVRKALELGVDYLLTMDADLQFNPEDIPHLLKPLMEDRADFVTGSRFSDPEHFPAGIPKVKHFGNLAMARLVSVITGKRFKDVSCGFRAYTRECLLHLNLKGQFTYTQESFIDLVAKQMRLEEVSVRVRYFEGRISRVAGSVIRYGMKTSAIILRALIDYRPLWLFSRLSVGVAFCGMILAVPVIRNLLTVGTFTPYKFLAFLSGVSFLLSLAMFSIGLIGQLLARIRQDQEYLIYLSKRQAFGADRPRAEGSTS